MHLMEQEDSVKDYSAQTANDIELYLRQHYTEEISLEFLADIMGFHAVYLNRVFKKKNRLPHSISDKSAHGTGEKFNQGAS